jgi:acetyl-CoA carboxylase carboxyltransferase component
MRRVIVELVDGGEFLELKPQFGRGLVSALARIDGYAVGVLASNPMYQAGTLDPAAADKATRLLCLCEAFGLPLVFLHDSPGFLVGRQVEHGRLIFKAVLFLQAMALATTPRFAVVIRKSYGLAHPWLAGAGARADLLVAWPGAEIGFMDPEVAANVLYGNELLGLDPAARAERHRELALQMRLGDDPYGAAQIFTIDEIIHPDETRAVLAEALRRHADRPLRPPSERPLCAWPTCW